MTLRRLGVEEELLLTDAITGELRPSANEVIAACETRVAADGRAERRARVKHEFYLSQIEVATTPQIHLGVIRDELTDARARIGKAGAPMGVAPVAVPGPVLAVSSGRFDDVSPGERYARVRRHYGEVARQSLMCALHVHVEVEDEHEGVAVIDRVRPWIPVLVAMTANSPYWRGQDVGYDSWRSRVLSMWPTGGPVEPFGDPATYHRVVEGLMRSGVALDKATVNLDVRLSHRYPTVEFRVADVCTDLDDTLMIVALARALVTHFADVRRAGTPADDWRVDELKAASWRAARFGLSDSLVSPESRELVDAWVVVKQLVTLLAAPLENAGDTTAVSRAIAALQARGNGATRQRTTFVETGDLAGVVADLQVRTLQS